MLVGAVKEGKAGALAGMGVRASVVVLVQR